MASKKKATAAKPAAKAKAKAKPKAKAAKPATQAATEKDMLKMPGEQAVKDCAKAVNSARHESGEIATDLSEMMGNFKKNKGIHPGAIKRVAGLINKAKKADRGLTAVATEIAHFEYYCDVLGLTKMIEQQGQMFTRPEAGEAADEETDTGTGDKSADTFKPLHEAAPKFGGPKSRAKPKPKPDETVAEFTEREVNESFGAETLN